MKLILASASIGRKNLLAHLKIPFEVMVSDVDEDKIIGPTPLQTLKMRAKAKAGAVLSRLSPKSPRLLKLLKSLKSETGYLILSADSGAILGDKHLEKPKDYEDAVRILKLLSGKKHKFVTTIYAIEVLSRASELSRHSGDPDLIGGLQNLASRRSWTPARWCCVSCAAGGSQDDIIIRTFQTHAVSWVTFRKLTDKDISNYLKISYYTKFAGGYAIDASPQDFVKKIEGSTSNIIGLPLEKVIPLLKRYKILYP